MASLRKLAGQTAIYGLPSIIGRFMNFLLVPLHTNVFEPAQFGIITEMYAYVAFLVVLLNYGLETAFFRFASQRPEEKSTVFASAVKMLVVTTGVFIALAFYWAEPIAAYLKYPDQEEFVKWFAIIVGFDAISTIPLARLRLEGRAIRFAVVNLTSIGVFILLNLVLIALPAYFPDNVLSAWLREADLGVGFVFIANLVASVAKLLMLAPELTLDFRKFSAPILKAMLRYGFPLIFVGLAGIVNETFDRILLKYLLFDELGEEATMTQVGIYGACYKLAIILQLFIQAFRYAAEPFFFSHEKDRNAPEAYARIMQYFVIICSTIFLVVVLYLDLFRYFIPNESFWVGLPVVPVLLFAYIFLGIYYNLSVWFKLSSQTGKGAIISIIGAIVTIVLNIILIPVMGFYGAAWATFFCYLSMCIISYLWGKKHYHIPYKVPSLFLYLAAAAALYFISRLLPPMEGLPKYAAHAVLLILFIALAWFREFRGKKRIFAR